MFQVSVSVQLGDGNTARFWTDAWLDGVALTMAAPNLLKAISRSGQMRTVKDALLHHQWARDITGALTAPVLYDYALTWERLENVELQPLLSDRFVWRWTENGVYSASSAYRSFFLGISSLLGAKDIWKAATPPKVKFFLWLALHGRL